jgi:DNA-directed RNA polymerase subunit RPC12/RpoP
MKTVELIIWFCGFYEGEGSVSNDKSNNNRLRLSISQNDVTPLELGKSIWGGSIRERIRESKNKTCHGHEWVLNHNQALVFIEDIKPYMKIPYKINQLETVMKHMNDKGEGSYKCNFCDKVYTLAANRRRHELTSHIKKDQLFTCTRCSNEYMSRDSLVRHLKKCQEVL